jgi:hypothetical protein
MTTAQERMLAQQKTAQERQRAAQERAMLPPALILT